MPRCCLSTRPNRLISPASLLRRRRGNSYEMATLLCSMLVRAGYPAMVVSGTARADTVLNDQSKIAFPYQIKELKTEDEEHKNKLLGEKYKLRTMPDLKIHLEENIAEMFRNKETDERRIREEAERLKSEEMELIAVDRYHFRRSHAWVVIIDNAPCSIKSRRACPNVNGYEAPEAPKVRFVEPTTGFICDTHCKQYILIESVWDHQNYYVNMQKYQRVSEIRWNLQDSVDWVRMLPGEPSDMREYALGSDENVTESLQSLSEEKHLDTIQSWVMKLHIDLRELEERYPKLEKTINYAFAVHDRFSPYSQSYGKVGQVTLYKDIHFKEPRIRWEYYESRADLLQQIKFIFNTGKIEETFLKGRDDSLRFMEHNINSNEPKTLHFNPETRVDSLKSLSASSEKIILKYSERADRCTFQEFEFKPGGRILKKTTEKFELESNGKIPAYKAIAERTILFYQRKILLKFHYGRGALTSSTLEFCRPSKPNYGHEVSFDPSNTKSYKANVSDPDPTPLELYKLLLEEFRHEEKVKRQFEKLVEEINGIFDLRGKETSFPVLKFSIFDPLRNGSARSIRIQQVADEESFKLDMSKKSADFLAPYLVPYKNTLPTYKESCAAVNSCLMDIKIRSQRLLNDLQRQYEDLTTESKSLNRFLEKFEGQFYNFSYEKLVERDNFISLRKRMVQQRLTSTYEESKKKNDFVKSSLLKDVRLNFS
ncbi:coiled-coil domain-containing protein lobo [Eurosta solidaginis]|uniref:coiled-coil domain-containing protein lobo n=1 Tax=Eurosta solidaginis TaxID=178769 RepID=UPI0035315055